MHEANKKKIKEKKKGGGGGTNFKIGRGEKNEIKNKQTNKNKKNGWEQKSVVNMIFKGIFYFILFFN